MDRTLSSPNSLALSTGKHNLVLGKSSSKHIQGFWCLVKIQHYTKPFPKAIVDLARTGFPSFPLAQRVAESSTGFSWHADVVVT